MQNLKSLASLCRGAGRCESYLVGNPDDRFSRDVAQIIIEDQCCVLDVFLTNGKACHVNECVLSPETGPYLSSHLKYLLIFCNRIIEPRYDKTNKVTVRPPKAQISLGIRPV